MPPLPGKKTPVLLMVLSTLSFALMALSVRMSGDLPLFEKVFFRNLVMLLIVVALIRKEGIPFRGQRASEKFLVVRALLGFAGVVLFFYAIQNTELATATTLNKLSPFFVVIFAALFLHEKLSRMQFPALLIAFLGLVLIMRPRADASLLPALAGLLSALASGLAYTTVRHLGKLEHPYTIIFYFCAISTLISLPLMMIDPVLPGLRGLFFLVLTGVFAAMGQYLMTLAYRFERASVISVYNYTHVLWAILLGLIFYDEVLDPVSILGIALIIIAGVGLWLYGKWERMPSH